MSISRNCVKAFVILSIFLLLASPAKGFSRQQRLKIYLPAPRDAKSRIGNTKQRPPIVGVPSFFMCQRGPIARIFCPIFFSIRTGIRSFPVSAVQRKQITAEKRNQSPTFILFRSPSGDDPFRGQTSACLKRGRRRSSAKAREPLINTTSPGCVCFLRNAARAGSSS